MSDRALPELGVVVPTLNAAGTLPATLDSLAAVRGCRISVVVVDSGSTDGTRELCERRGIPTGYVPPGNMYAAVNAGLADLHAEWLTYLNGDDTVYPDAYAQLIAAGSRSGAELVYGDCDFVDAAGRRLYRVRGVRAPQVRATCEAGLMPFCQPAAVFRRELYERLGGFDERYGTIADFDFFYRAALAGARLHYLPRALAAFRLHEAQITARARLLVNHEVEGYTAALATSRWRTSSARWQWRLRNWRYLGARVRGARRP